MPPLQGARIAGYRAHRPASGAMKKPNRIRSDYPATKTVLRSFVDIQVLPSRVPPSDSPSIGCPKIGGKGRTTMLGFVVRK